ncbi:MAG: M3 family oligoendopeptidase [Caldilineales bacterium]|nr:M3 family oligoendopeptidase [Caldilineales bacterium]
MIRNFPTGIDALDWGTVQPHYDALLDRPLQSADVRGWLQDWSDLSSVIDEASAQVYRDVTENTADADADARFKKLVSEILPAHSKAEQAMKTKLLAVPGFEPDDETRQLVQQFQAEADIFREENIPLISEVRLLDKQYDEIIGGLSIEWQGEQKTIPQAEVLLSDPDPSVREQIWRLAMDQYLEQRQKLNDLFLQLLQRRRQIAANAGFDNFREYQWRSMGRFDYSPADCFTFADAIEHEVVPLATDIYRSLQNRLKLGTLRPWDLGINSPWLPTIDPEPQPLHPFDAVGTLEETATTIFRKVDPDFGDYFTAMRDGYLDLPSRPNKAPGGYCNAFPVSGQPYIFMNAAGSHRNVSTLLHEGGHSFHFAEAYRAQSLLWNYHAPMEFCEVASMSMELLSSPYWSKAEGGFYSEEDTRRAFAEELMGSVLFLPYMAVMDGFQHWLYVENTAEPDISDLDAKWWELWDRYMPGIDFSDLQAQKESGWHRKGHIFGVPFYYVEYGLAQLGAFQVWRNSLEDYEAAVAAYRKALAAGNTRSLTELFSLAGVQFGFDRALLRQLMYLVRDFLQID